MDKQLTHYGVLGMKWGKRRYQNKDGSLTPAGIQRYGDSNRDDLVLEGYNKSMNSYHRSYANTGSKRRKLRGTLTNLAVNIVKQGVKAAIASTVKDVATTAAVNAGKQFVNNAYNNTKVAKLQKKLKR